MAEALSSLLAFLPSAYVLLTNTSEQRLVYWEGHYNRMHPTTHASQTPSHHSQRDRMQR